VGTSTDRTSGTGGAWTDLKYAATSYFRGIGQGSAGTGSAKLLLARHVPVLGGAAAAVAGATAGRTSVQRLGGLLAGIGANGLGQTLREASLGDLVGRDRFEIVDELVTALSSDGSGLDAAAARDAMCDVLEELFGDADTWEELQQTRATRDDIERLLHLFLTNYLYNRIPVIAERLGRITDPAAAVRADGQMRQVIEDCVVISLPTDPLSIDWNGPQGRDIADQAMRVAYDTLESLA
jgi:hypothetical protein